MSKYKLNKLGYSTGFTWVFGLVTIFGLGLLYIVFDQVFRAYLVPTIKNTVNSSISGIDTETKNIIFGNIDKFITYWSLLPFILFGVVVLYMIIAAIRKERETY